MTYRQEHSWIEDGYGEVRIVFTVSDSYNGTFAAESQSVNIFLLDSVAKKLPDSGGGVAEIDLKLTVDEQLANDTVSQAAVVFVKAARNPRIFRYCTVFINPGASLTVDNMLFSGVIEPNMEAEDLRWYGEHFEHTEQPLRRWSLTAKAFANVLLQDYVKLEDIIKGDVINNIPGLTGSWVDTNVVSRLGYYSRNNAEVKYERMVVLDNVLLKLFSNFTTAMVAGGYPTFTITTEGCKFPFRIHPARWNYSESVLGKDLPELDIVFGADVARICLSPLRNYRSMDMAEYGCYHIYDDDFVEAKIDLNNSLPNTYKRIELNFDAILETWVKFDSLSDLLISLARNYGLVVELTMTTTTNLHIKFSPIQTSTPTKVFLRSATDAKLKISSEKISEKDIPSTKCAKYVGQELHFPVYGIDRKYDPPTYKDYSNEKIVWLSRDKAKTTLNAQGDYIPTTLPPVIAQINNALYLPANIQVYKNGAVYRPNMLSTNSGYHTGIYVGVSKYSTHKKYDKSFEPHDDPDWITWQPDTYLAPGAMITVAVKNRITGEYEEKNFFSFTDYIMMLNGRAEEFIQTEYSLGVHGYYAFSASNSPLAPDWKALALGNELDLFGLSNVVKEIKWSLKDPKIEIKLVSSTIYDFDTSSSPSAGGGGTFISSPYLQSLIESLPAEATIVDADLASIPAGNVCIKNADNELAVATASSAYYNSELFVVSEMAGMKSIMSAGAIIANDSYNFSSAGLPVFLRTAPTASDFNISTSPLEGYTPTEDLYCVVGVTTGTHSWLFNPGFKMYYKEVLNP